MAFELLIQLYQKDSNEPFLELEPLWWPVRKILQNFPFQLEKENDFVQSTFINKAQLTDLHLDYLHLLQTGTYGFPAWQKQLHAKVVTLEKIIEGRISYYSLKLLVREWESGL